MPLATAQAQGPADGALLRLSYKNGGDRHLRDEDWGAKPCPYLNVANARTVPHLVIVARNRLAILQPGAGVALPIPWPPSDSAPNGLMMRGPKDSGKGSGGFLTVTAFLCPFI
jgi:hypothetical protein